ncbi:TetR/AcrR family transcriptional regulator [Agromyces italicus]|uniref:TetR/AcrR family transcriptional regulator n=1 Tax=Agromyces italicus TaxID=279572 RepID=UPI0003B4BD1F|nr:TetR/AcrR family transcriptional regulator [Agromyces italicus]
MRTTIDADAITDAAVSIADRDGLGAVSMRRVGTELGVSGMALYRHVADRDDLVLRMAARTASSRALLPPADAAWRESLEHLAERVWDSFEQHPWLLGVVVSPTRMLDLASAEQTGTLLARLGDAGVDADTAGDLLVGATAIVIGVACLTLPPLPRGIDFTLDRLAPRDAAVDDADAADAIADAARFRARPFDAARGRDILRATLTPFLDGIEESLTPPRTPHRDAGA